MIAPTQAQIEALELLKLIDAEFQSDPMSVQCFDLRIVKRVNECVTALTAAAQVGEPMPTNFPHGRLLVNATIERCAKVAEAFAPDVNVGQKLIAAAIRNLKE